ncbi:NAD(P)H-dependent glycerol-3-phosphate dehydrogenase [Minwuia sp.]|uniref:NAD(P)H-dependent glycerol-3-phosphate dehydrogenase n=1 Tax=Minwuia sp. TaxID=2493630 RepID=UPI003A8D25EE
MNRVRKSDLAIVGAGAWGTALAICVGRAGCDVVLWGRDGAALAALLRSGTHPALPDASLPDRVTVTDRLPDLCGVETILLATPAQAIRAVAGDLDRTGVVPDRVIVAAKGIEQSTRCTMPELAGALWPSAEIGMLSGPTFATELARGLPAAATLAASDLTIARELARFFAGSDLRLYASDDLTGVAMGGAVKNVLAIAAGAVMGARLGANARAAVISRGLAELTRLGLALGARPETLSGLSGLGDLVLSCTDEQSRNYSFGFALGRGEPPPAKLAEGALTAAPLVELARRHRVEMPIAEAVNAVLNDGLPLREAVAGLLKRPEGLE